MAHIGSERPACLHAVVDAFAVGGQLRRTCGRRGWRTSSSRLQVQADAAEEAIGLEQLRLVGDQLGRAAAGDGPGEQHLRGPVDGVHVAQAVQRRRARSRP